MANNDYFVYLLPEGVTPMQTAEDWNAYEGLSKLTLEDVRQALQGLGKKIGDHSWAGRSGFILDECLVFSPKVVDGRVGEIMVQGSLSWFPDGLADIYRVRQDLVKRVPVRFYLPKDEIIEAASEQAFVEAMTSLYEKKLTAFTAKYGAKKVKVHADGYFKMNGNNWKNLFGLLR